MSTQSYALEVRDDGHWVVWSYHSSVKAALAAVLELPQACGPDLRLTQNGEIVAISQPRTSTTS